MEGRLRTAVRAYKCLRPGRIGPFSGFSWPVGAWVEAEDSELCLRGIHACRTEDLPYWLTEELWEIELDGEVERQPRKLVAGRGRLVHRIETWTPAVAGRFAEACAVRTEERAARTTGEHSGRLAELAGDAAANSARGESVLLGFIAARAAEVDAGVDGYAEERRAQARWLASELGLGAA
jgi:hypothetical protein